MSEESDWSSGIASVDSGSHTVVCSTKGGCLTPALEVSWGFPRNACLVTLCLLLLGLGCSAGVSASVGSRFVGVPPSFWRETVAAQKALALNSKTT